MGQPGSLLKAKKVLAASAARLKRRVASRWGSEPTFLVGGTGRCGTGYVAAVLNAAGVPCGHESAFTTNGPEPVLRGGDVSWMAYPYLAEYSGPVFHVVRHPMAVINSYMRLGWFEESRDGGLHKRFARKHFRFTGDELVDAMRWYSTLNRAFAEASQLTFRIEEPREGLREIVRTVRPERLARLDEAIRRTPTNTNNKVHQRNRPSHLTLDQLPSCAEKITMLELAKSYGYEVNSET